MTYQDNPCEQEHYQAGDEDMVLSSPTLPVVRDLNMGGAPIRSDSGEIIGAVIVAREMTERRRQEQQTQRMLDTILNMIRVLEGGKTENLRSFMEQPRRRFFLAATREALARDVYLYAACYTDASGAGVSPGLHSAS